MKTTEYKAYLNKLNYQETRKEAERNFQKLTQKRNTVRFLAICIIVSVVFQILAIINMS